MAKHVDRYSHINARPLDFAPKREEWTVEIIGMERYGLDAEVDVFAQEVNIASFPDARRQEC